MESKHTARGANLPTLRDLRRENVIDELESVKQIPNLTVGFYLYGICEVPFFSSETIHVFEVYSMLSGLSRLPSNPDDLYKLPALYIHAVRIINDERGVIMRQKKGS